MFGTTGVSIFYRTVLVVCSPEASFLCKYAVVKYWGTSLGLRCFPSCRSFCAISRNSGSDCNLCLSPSRRGANLDKQHRKLILLSSRLDENLLVPESDPIAPGGDRAAQAVAPRPWSWTRNQDFWRPLAKRLRESHHCPQPLSAPHAREQRPSNARYTVSPRSRRRRRLWSASNIKDLGGRRRQISQQDFFRSFKFQAVGSLSESRRLSFDSLVVSDHLRVHYRFLRDWDFLRRNTEMNILLSRLNRCEINRS